MRLYIFFISCMIFIMPSLLVFLLQFTIKGMLHSEVVNYTAKKVSTFAHVRELVIEDMFNTLPQSLDYKCNISDVSLLRDPKYYNQFIRVLGIITSGARCSSSGVDLNNDVLAAIYNNDGDGSFILSTPQDGHEYIMAHKSDKGLFYAILNNAWIDPMLAMICEGCFNVIVNAKVNNSYASVIKGDMKSPAWAHSVHQEGAHFHMSLTPTTLLSAKVENWYNQYAYIISSLFGGILLFFYFIVFSHRQISYKVLISKALENDEFVPYYQPIVDSSCTKIIGAEVLVRWIRANGEVVYPSSFINDIESDDRMLMMLTTKLIDQVCQDKQRIGHQDKLWFSINIGSRHFMNDDLLNYMSRIGEYGKGIAFEITERQPLHDLRVVASYVDALKNLGHKIKIDDFGVGYGGFSYLQEIDVDAIKIDKMFVDTIGTDDVKIKVLESIISMAQENNYEIIAEGVENVDQVRYLLSKNVRFIQGYYYSPPVNIDDFLILIKVGICK